MLHFLEFIEKNVLKAQHYKTLTHGPRARPWIASADPSNGRWGGAEFLFKNMKLFWVIQIPSLEISTSTACEVGWKSRGTQLPKMCLQFDVEVSWMMLPSQENDLHFPEMMLFGVPWDLVVFEWNICEHMVCGIVPLLFLLASESMWIYWYTALMILKHFKKMRIILAILKLLVVHPHVYSCVSVHLRIGSNV